MVHYGLPSSGKHAPCVRIEHELLSDARHSWQQMVLLTSIRLTPYRHPWIRELSRGVTFSLHLASECAQRTHAASRI